MEIEVATLDHDINVANFNFGNGSIAIKLRNAYYLQLMRKASSKEILINNKCVGYYIISISSVDSDDTTSYYAIKLDILCIDVDYQNQNIGTEVLKNIISDAIEFSDFAGCRYLVIDALKGKFEWYYERGFIPFNENDLKNDNPTIKMFIDFRDNDLVNEYADE